MTDSRRFLFLLLSGLLLFGGMTAVVLERTEPVQAVADSPILEVAAPVETTTSTTEVEQSAVPPPAAVPAPSTAKRAVAPPRNAYAPEPIVEIGVIEIPKIGLRHKVMHGISLRNIDQGPSHWPGTPLPGEQGNTVFAGHRVTHSHPFRRINELTPGDEIIFVIGGVRSRYLMTGSEIVAPNRLDIVDPTPNPIVTLFACHPPGSARQRYVVRGALESTEAAPAAADPAAPSS